LHARESGGLRPVGDRGPVHTVFLLTMESKQT
jgi:hypothetical protein